MFIEVGKRVFGIQEMSGDADGTAALAESHQDVCSWFKVFYDDPFMHHALKRLNSLSFWHSFRVRRLASHMIWRR